MTGAAPLSIIRVVAFTSAAIAERRRIADETEPEDLGALIIHPSCGRASGAGGTSARGIDVGRVPTRFTNHRGEEVFMSDTVPMQLAGYSFQVAEDLHEMLDGALIDAVTFMRGGKSNVYLLDLRDLTGTIIECGSVDAVLGISKLRR